jgi:hypothetical protein
MARLKGEELLRMQKEAKLKKLLFVLVPVFLALMVWQGPGYVKMLTGGGEQAAEPTATPTASAPTTPDPTTAPPPSTAAPGGTPVAAPGGTPATLADSDQPAPPDAGQVNGVKERVPLEGTFPESEKLFVLTKLTRTGAWIGLVAGEYSNGKDAIEVGLGKTLNLVSQPDGIRYTIRLVRIRLR